MEDKLTYGTAYTHDGDVGSIQPAWNDFQYGKYSEYFDWVDDWDEVEVLADQYPALERAIANFKTIYLMVKNHDSNG